MTRHHASSTAGTGIARGRSISRRGALGRLAGLWALGMWPGARAAANRPPSPAAGGGFRFVVLNDFHHEDAACDPWMEALFRQVAETDKAAFCLGLGDLANRGERASLERIAALSELAGMPFYASPGNHDLDRSPVDGFFAEVFPGRRNYTFAVAGWQFVVVDTTEGAKWENVSISADTLGWLDTTLPTLDPRAPTVLATHFPLASEVRMCPLNAENLLARFVGFNLRGVFSGHFHGQTVSVRGAMEMVTNVCVSRVRGNHDGTDFKGYWVCEATATGDLRRRFTPFAGV